ncbi:MAG: penicillin-binding protein 2 [Gammaproteobacteria bacterium RIFOXYA12_FULL_61_12]|nr:MAG: penicillin-binding protein 2 [Gammaproteobacteria bacterium RIFOXYD12_FULL_61_37]OGT92950.1 MAG: penicillin-binding protein 2 [Gammaproteobacteria bacterium RIFOXYA12_FULL_61_12]
MSQPTTFKDYQRETRLFSSRVVASAVIVTLLIFANIGHMFRLQVLEHEKYRTDSRENRVKLRPLPPTRGLIYDRNGVLLADNRLTFSLEITPYQVKNLEETIASISKIVTISDKDRQRFNRLRRQFRRFDSVPIRINLSDEELGRFAVNSHLFQGVDINAFPVREYPLKELTSHVVGYVARISERDLLKLSESEYSGSSHIGKTGLEQSYETELHGKVGIQQVEVNAAGRPIRVLDKTPPQGGRNLYLNLDTHIQEIAMSAFGEYNGSAIAIDLATGGVITMVSKPGFDPNLFVDGIAQNIYQALLKSPDKPLYDRALKGQYPPGSTVKPFVAWSGLASGVTQFANRTYCRGYFLLPGQSHQYRCWKKAGHGSVNMGEAITRSCDVFFYDLAHKLGIERFGKLMSTFGFGQKTGVDLKDERDGVLPSPEWKRSAIGQVWYPGETVISGTGQGYFLVTPMQLATAAATMATAGTRKTPRLVAHTQLGDDEKTRKAVPYETYKSNLTPGKGHDQIVNAMVMVVEGAGGTARRIANDAYSIAGKTGTAQVFTVKQGQSYDEDRVPKHMRDHALFIAFAPADNPRIAVGVIAENAGHGGSVAAPIAKEIMDAYLLWGKNDKW